MKKYKFILLFNAHNNFCMAYGLSIDCLKRTKIKNSSKSLRSSRTLQILIPAAVEQIEKTRGGPDCYSNYFSWDYRNYQPPYITGLLQLVTSCIARSCSNHWLPILISGLAISDIKQKTIRNIIRKLYEGIYR